MFCLYIKNHNLLFLPHRVIGSNAKAGAQTTIYCALEESITKHSGRFFDNCRLAEEETDLVRDKGVAKKLWDISCQATGL